MAVPDKQPAAEPDPSTSGPVRTIHATVNFYGIEQTQEEGRELFLHFLNNQIAEANVQPVGIEEDLRAHNIQFIGRAAAGNASAVDENCHINQWAKTGTKLRTLADQFAQSKGRSAVREEANMVQLNEDIKFEDIRGFLESFFTDGNNPQERIITLFFFLSDLLIRTCKNKLANIAQKIFQWSIAFIVGKVSNWVQENGGWSAIFGGFFENIPMLVTKLFVSVATAAVAVGVICLLWKGSSK